MTVDQAKEILAKIQAGTATPEEKAKAALAFDLVKRSAAIRPPQ